VAAVQVVGGELGGDAAPRVGQAGADDRDVAAVAADQAQRVGQQAGRAEHDQHHRQGRAAGRVRGAGGREQAGADDAQRDRPHRQVLVTPGVLAQHPLRQQQQHQQAGRERRLHDDQRRQQ